MIEHLDLVTFSALSAIAPKEVLGYSDISTLRVASPLISSWATAHGPNLMDMPLLPTDPLTISGLAVLADDFQITTAQHGFGCFKFSSFISQNRPIHP